MENNVFLNKELFYTHQNKDYREQRLRDFESIYLKLKNHLAPTEFVEFDEKLMRDYINAHKKQNRPIIENLLSNIRTTTFEQLKIELIKHAKSFTSSKYIYVVGATSDKGENIMNFDLFKSNLWTFMLIYEHLPNKPYDIILNLSTAIRLYLNPSSSDSIKDFLITDDASYSGEQLINNIINPASVELSFVSQKEGYKPVTAIFKPITEKFCNLHIMIPFLSNRVVDRLNIVDLTTAFCVKRYISFVILTLENVLPGNYYSILSHLFNQYYTQIYFGNLVPFHFDYKIADMVSTLEIVLVKGKVLDDPKKQIVFLKKCNSAGKDMLYKKIDCPVPPYKRFYSLL